MGSEVIDVFQEKGEKDGDEKGDGDGKDRKGVLKKMRYGQL